VEGCAIGGANSYNLKPLSEIPLGRPEILDRLINVDRDGLCQIAVAKVGQQKLTQARNVVRTQIWWNAGNCARRNLVG
jgi:hypothetical protein